VQVEDVDFDTVFEAEIGYFEEKNYTADKSLLQFSNFMFSILIRMYNFLLSFVTDLLQRTFHSFPATLLREKIYPFSQLMCFSSILYNNASTEHRAIHACVIIISIHRQVEIIYQGGAIFLIKLEAWSQALIAELCQLENKLLNLLSPLFFLKEFPFKKLTDDLGRAAIFKQQKMHYGWILFEIPPGLKYFNALKFSKMLMLTERHAINGWKMSKPS
jgi:hypothetical protein